MNSSRFLLNIRESLVHDSSFDWTRWDHWLLILCFVTVAGWGLWLARRWRS
ncbi:MAG: hypothetical protein AAFW95_03335 [Cyanobacteria bacterium J06638_6]